MSKERQSLYGVEQKPSFLDRLSIRAKTLRNTIFWVNSKDIKPTLLDRLSKRGKTFMDNFRVDSKDVKIRGVDPKSHGSFDRFMDRATRFLRIYGSKALIFFMLSGCTTGVIDVIVKTSEAGETSALSGDSTKTPESPTAVATEMPTATATEMPTPTKEKSLIEGNIFFDPQSKEDFKEVALAPSPIDEPEKFALWHEEYLKQINEKLENYNGPTVELTKSRYNAEYGSMEFESEKWPVVGSYLYKWHGEDVLNKSYIFSKKSGGEDYVLLNTTFIPKSMAEMLLLEFNYDTPKEYLVILYSLSDKTKKRWPNEFLTDFDDTYRLTEEQLDSLFRIFFHKPENGDEELFSQMQFIFIGSK